MTKDQQITECVPNSSESRNMHVIEQVTDEIGRVKGVKLLDVDPGEAINRTVVAFVSSPDNVLEAAFQVAKEAAQLIDMRSHHGTHPRMGTTDVCSLIPVASTILEEYARLTQRLARQIADELSIPCYCYETAAWTPERKNLTVCRAGEYEALPEKMNDPAKTPDSGARPFDEDVACAGYATVGAHDFLIAANFNLNTTSIRHANTIASDVREKGRPHRESNSPAGKPMKDEHGKTIMILSALKGARAARWCIDEYVITQVSMSIADINATPSYVAFDEVCRCAQNRDIRVTGTETVGLVSKRTLIGAGEYFLRKQNHSTGIPEEGTLAITVKSLGLDDPKPFNPREKVIEHLLEDDSKRAKLIDLTMKESADETSRGSPAPGGGTISTYMDTLDATLGTMVANLSSYKTGWDSRWEKFSNWADRGQGIKAELMHLVNEDTETLNRIMAAFDLSRETDEDKAAHSTAIQEATLYATQVPLHTMKAAYKVFELCKAMAQEDNPSSVSGVGVGVLTARAVILGAGLNIRINVSGLKNHKVAGQLVNEANRLIDKANQAEVEVMRIVESRL